MLYKRSTPNGVKRSKHYVVRTPHSTQVRADIATIFFRNIMPFFFTFFLHRSYEYFSSIQPAYCSKVAKKIILESSYRFFVLFVLFFYIFPLANRSRFCFLVVDF